MLREQMQIKEKENLLQQELVLAAVVVEGYGRQSGPPPPGRWLGGDVALARADRHGDPTAHREWKTCPLCGFGRRVTVERATGPRLDIGVSRRVWRG